MALSVSCMCCALVSTSAECCGYLCYLSVVMRLWPLWSNPVPLSLIWCTCVVPLFLECCVICHMVLIAQCGKVLRLPLRSYCLYNRISQLRFDTPRVIWVSWHFQPVSVQVVALDLVSDVRQRWISRAARKPIQIVMKMGICRIRVLSHFAQVTWGMLDSVDSMWRLTYKDLLKRVRVGAHNLSKPLLISAVVGIVPRLSEGTRLGPGMCED